MGRGKGVAYPSGLRNHVTGPTRVGQEAGGRGVGVGIHPRYNFAFGPGQRKQMGDTVRVGERGDADLGKFDTGHP